MLNDLGKGIWSELAARQPIDMYRRNLQKAFVERLIGLTNPAVPVVSAMQPAFSFQFSPTISKKNDVISVAKLQLRNLQSGIRAALPAYKDATSRAHLMDLNDRITAALDPTTR